MGQFNRSSVFFGSSGYPLIPSKNRTAIARDDTWGFLKHLKMGDSQNPSKSVRPGVNPKIVIVEVWLDDLGTPILENLKILGGWNLPSMGFGLREQFNRKGCMVSWSNIFAQHFRSGTNKLFQCLAGITTWWWSMGWWHHESSRHIFAWLKPSLNYWVVRSRTWCRSACGVWIVQIYLHFLKGFLSQLHIPPKQMESVKYGLGIWMWERLALVPSWL